MSIPLNGGEAFWETQLTATELTTTEIIALWFRITAAVANVLFPVGEMSVLLPSLLVDNFSSMRIAFYGRRTLHF